MAFFLHPTCLISFILFALAVPRANAQITYLVGKEEAMSIGAFAQGGEASASGIEFEGLLTPKTLISVGYGTTSVGVSEADDFDVTTVVVGAHGLFGRQGVDGPLTASFGVNAGVVTLGNDGTRTISPLLGLMAQAVYVAMPPSGRVFIAPSGSFALTTIFDGRLAATTPSLGVGLGLGLHLTPDVVLAATPNISIAQALESGVVIAFSASFGLTFAY